jgi:hypothetical protein
MKNKSNKSVDLLPEILQILVPEEYLGNFELVEVRNLPNCWEIELHEKASIVPKILLEKEVVLDGYCNSISIMSHCFSLKKVFLVVHRRRWKERGSNQHYSNEYEFTPGGAKITKELAAFLKGRD